MRIVNTCIYLYTICAHIRKLAQVCTHLLFYLSVPLKVFICFLRFGVRIWLFSDFLHDETVDSFDGFYTPHDQAYPLGCSWKTSQSQSSLSYFSCSGIPDPDSHRSCTYSMGNDHHTFLITIRLNTRTGTLICFFSYFCPINCLL